MKDFCISLFQKEQEERAIKIYYGECLRTISENTAKIGGGSYIEIKLHDLLNPKQEDNRTKDEIVEGIRKKLK